MTTNTVTIDMAAIREFAKTATHQCHLIEYIYGLVIPNFDNVKKVNTWPACNTRTWGELCNICIDYDRKHHPSVLNGGIWLNNGFGQDNTLENGVVTVDLDAVEYKKPQTVENSAV